MTFPLVSVIIPCYNGAPFLAEAIASILAQTYWQMGGSIELIVVDNGSTDQTSEVIARYPTVRSRRLDPNQGPATARNVGWAISQGEYLVFLDCDDRLLPSAIAVGVAHLQAHPDCALTFGRFYGIDVEGRQSPNQSPKEFIAVTYATMLEGQVIMISPGQGMFRRSIVQQLGGFDRTKWASEDFDLQLRLSRQFSVHYHTEWILEYRNHDRNLTKQVGVTTLLKAVLHRLDEQWPYIRHDRIHRAAYHRGKRHWRSLLGPYVIYDLVSQLKRREYRQAFQIAFFLAQHYPQGFGDYGQECLSRGWQWVRQSWASGWQSRSQHTNESPES